MAWVSLDDRFHANPKVVGAGNAAAGVYARALSYCGDYLTDGFVPRGWALEAGGAHLCRKLTEHGLWVEVSGGELYTYEVDGEPYEVRVPARGFFITDYLILNPAKTFVEGKRNDLSRKRAEAGRKGAAKRWGHNNTNSKPDSNTNGKATGKPIATGIATPWQPDSPTPLAHKDGEEDSTTPTSTLRDTAARPSTEDDQNHPSCTCFAPPPHDPGCPYTTHAPSKPNPQPDNEEADAIPF